MPPTVLYHAQCPDGFGAALACWLKFGEAAEYIPVRHSEPPPYDKIPPGTDIYIVDFSYDRETLLTLTDHQCTVTVLDHHQTAQAALTDFHHPQMATVFDMEESGATLTWRHLFHEDAPLLFQYLKDRDLWQWRLPSSREVSAALGTYPKDFATWYELVAVGDIQGLAREGSSILRHINTMVQALANNAVMRTIGGHRVPCVNTPLYGSEIGNYLCETDPCILEGLYPFAVCYSQQGDARWRWELRSVGDFDVSEVAKIYGGGGHKNAAGFITDDLLPMGSPLD